MKTYIIVSFWTCTNTWIKIKKPSIIAVLYSHINFLWHFLELHMQDFIFAKKASVKLHLPLLLMYQVFQMFLTGTTDLHE